MAVKFPHWRPERWHDLEENPLVSPPSEKPGSVIGDPQVLLPGEFDDLWHMFSHGRDHLYHFKSDDGVKWEFVREWYLSCSPCFLTHFENRWLFFYGHIERREGKVVLYLAVRTSENLEEWSEPVELLRPELDWKEEELDNLMEVRNPCLVQMPDGRFRLYYSSGTIFLNDTGYEEPKYISLAEADHMASEDGVKWEDAPFNPIIPPTNGWKRAFVYQLDAKFIEEKDGTRKIMLYYNARDDWKGGVERIGCSVLEVMVSIPGDRGAVQRRLKEAINCMEMWQEGYGL